MKKGQRKKFQATSLRSLLAVVFTVVIIGSGVGFYFGLQFIREYALDVSHSVTDSKASGTNIVELGNLKKQLTAGEGLVEKASKLFSTPATYQTQALKDISKYAQESGVTITSIDSTKAAADGSTPVEQFSEVITIESPVSYARFIKFLDAIEGSLPKMQITSITVGRPTVASGDLITTDKITVTISTR